MICKKCGTELADEMAYCWACGKKQTPTQRKRRTRGNGQGTIIKLKNGKYKAVVTTGYYIDDNGKKQRHTRSKVCTTRKDAAAMLVKLKESPIEVKKRTLTFKELYDQWEPTHRAGKSTMDCYHAAIRHYSDIWGLPISEIDIDDLQDCLDDCPHGKRTRENMKALAGLMYKYGIPRHLIPENMNLASFLIVTGGAAPARPAFTPEQVEAIRQQIGKAHGADYVYCLIYLGFRPSEFLALDCVQYDPVQQTLIGGAKTDAGKGRTVTISPRIQPIIAQIAAGRATGALFCDLEGGRYNLKAFTENVFYGVLSAARIENPVVEIGGGAKRHLYTPHCCRHTFANLLKTVDAPALDKQKLIGHASEQQLKYYQSASLDDLRRITDKI